MARRSTLRDLFTKNLEFKAAPCQSGDTCCCGCSKPRTPDPDLMKVVKRFQALTEWWKEPLGVIAWDAAQCGARWLSDGVVQEGPAVKWFDYDGQRAGWWQPGTDEINISRGCTLEETVVTVMHEVAHWWRNWDRSEDAAQLHADHLARRYMERLAA